MAHRWVACTGAQRDGGGVREVTGIQLERKGIRPAAAGLAGHSSDAQERPLGRRYVTGRCLFHLYSSTCLFRFLADSCRYVLCVRAIDFGHIPRLAKISGCDGILIGQSSITFHLRSSKACGQLR